ncbi:DUF362 domain-containing protein [Clostridium oceanicum]|uniref:Ferredoxin n=1 Tax=Clostridium oceanicum TaxID=1543 RepID=A0ABN1JB14_9CLOT
MRDIVLLKCSDYNVLKIENKIREGFELLGGEEFLKKLIPYNSKVLLKPNMLSVEKAGSPVITHYAFFEAVIRVLKDYSKDITFGDSPGFGDSKKVAENAGLLKVANKYDVKFDNFTKSVHVKSDESILCRSWTLAKAAYESDVLITLPKLKTHAMAYYTGAIKNQFGCVPGTLKAQWHTRMPNANNFCKMLLDLNKILHTDFAILDGIVAMEGNGPKSGTPYNLNSIIMGESLTAVDSTAVKLIGYDDPLEIPFLKEAYENKWDDVLEKDINVLGEKIENMAVKDFEKCRKGGSFYFINPTVTNFLRDIIAPDPVVIKDKCIGCERCLNVCPEKPKVIKMVKYKDKYIPKWDMKNCIRCFCCQELCPKGAIETKYSVLGRILNKNRR